MADRLRVQVLGPLQVSVAGTDVSPSGALRRSLFALLAMHPGEVLAVESLVDGLWGERPPETAAGVLQTYVSAWRKALSAGGDDGARISTVGRGYRLRLDEDESDLLRFRRLADEGRRLTEQRRPTDARTALEQALELWHGRALADLADRPFHAAAVRPVEEDHDQAVERWAELVLRTGSDGDVPVVVGELHRQRDLRPWRERTAELLMWGLFRQSRQREALDVYEETRKRLADDLGVDPGAALRAMHTRVLRQDPALQGPTPSAAQPRRAPRLDSFLGREEDLRKVSLLLGAGRLVTLTGPGGSGKTRLAEEVAAEYGPREGGETAVVELAAIEDAALVPGAIAARLDVASAGTEEALAARLADPLLLVLDNLEQIPDVGTMVTALLRAAPALQVLATSREPLHVAGEQQYPVDPLPLPPPGETDPARLAETPSVALLLDRARRTDPSLMLSDADAGPIRDLVRALDGLPLGLEIVAPWLAALTAEDLLAELRDPLDLRDRRTDATSRHRTLRTAIAWSVDRLSEQQQRLLTRLSVLRGGGDLAAVRAIGGSDLGCPVLDVLMDLVDRNLVQRAEPVAGAARFRLLETVRQFAAGRLAASGDDRATQVRAAEWYGSWSVGLAAHGQGPNSQPWLARVIAEADNLRAAMDVFERDGRAEDLLQLVVNAFSLWFDAGQEREGERRLEQVLACSGPATPTRALGMSYHAWLVAAHDFDRSERLVRDAVALARETGDAPVQAFALMVSGDVTCSSFEEPVEALAEAVALAESYRGRPVAHAPTAPDLVVAEAAAILAGIWVFRSAATAVEWQRRAVEVAERSGDERGLSSRSAVLGLVQITGGDIAGGRPHIERAVRLLDGSSTSIVEDTIPFAHAFLLRLTGDDARAEAVMRASIGVARAGGRIHHVHQQSCLLVDLLTDQGRLAEAEKALRLVEHLHGDSDVDQYVVDVRVRQARLLRLAGRQAVAAAVLAKAEKGIDPTFLRPEHMMFLVESALLADADEERRRFLDRLEDMSRQTGVPVYPWERRALERG